jgi:hypothetical protein
MTQHMSSSYATDGSVGILLHSSEDNDTETDKTITRYLQNALGDGAPFTMGCGHGQLWLLLRCCS